MLSWSDHIRALARERGFPGFLATAFSSGMALSFVIPFLSLWGTQAAGFSPFQFGMLMTASAICGITLSLVLGRLSDTRISRRSVLLIGSGGGALGYAGFALITNPWLLCLVAVSLVAAASVCFSQFFATARNWFHDRPNAAQGAPVALSVVRVCFSASGTIGPPIAATLVVRYGFSGLFLAVAALHTLVFLGALCFVPYHLRPAGPNLAKSMPLANTFRRPDVLGHFIALMLIATAFTISTMSLPLAVTGRLGGSPQDVGLIFGIGPLVEVPLTLWFGYLASRGYERALLKIGALVSALYFILLFSAGAVWEIYLIQMLSGASFAILTNVAIATVQNLMPGQPGLATAVFGNSGSIGKLAGYFVFGAFTNSLGPQGLFGICASLASVALLIFYLPIVRRRVTEADALHNTASP